MAGVVATKASAQNCTKVDVAEAGGLFARLWWQMEGLHTFTAARLEGSSLAVVGGEKGRQPFMNRLVDGQHDPLLAFRVRLRVAALPVKGVGDINRTKGSLGRGDISNESQEARARTASAELSPTAEVTSWRQSSQDPRNAAARRSFADCTPEPASVRDK